jgi:hypothetical protein
MPGLKKIAELKAACASLKQEKENVTASYRRLSKKYKATGNKQHKQINKQYTKQCLMTKQTVPKDAIRRYKHLSAGINQIRATIKKL